MPTDNQRRNDGIPLDVAVDLQSPQLHQGRGKKPTKAYHVVPQEDAWLRLQEPLSASSSDDSAARRSKHQLLASSRIERDKLMRVMEDLILKEAELASAYELFEYTRKKACDEHEEIVVKLSEYEELLKKTQERERELQGRGLDDVLKTPQDRERWERIKIMVQSTLPELLVRLEESIAVNGAKIRHIQEKMEEIRAQRLSLREEIAEKEEDIALALASCSSTE